MPAARGNRLLWPAGLTALEAVQPQHRHRAVCISGVGLAEVGHLSLGKEQTTSRRTHNVSCHKPGLFSCWDLFSPSSKGYILSEQLYRLDKDFSRQSNAKPDTWTTEYHSELSLSD